MDAQVHVWNINLYMFYTDNMKKMLNFWADYHEDMMDDLGELIELRAKAVNG